MKHLVFLLLLIGCSGDKIYKTVQVSSIDTLSHQVNVIEISTGSPVPKEHPFNKHLIRPAYTYKYTGNPIVGETYYLEVKNNLVDF